MASLAVLAAFAASATWIKGISAQTVSTVPGAPQQVLSQPLSYSLYGIHEPQGLSAVQYLYGSEGTWRSFTGLENVYGYYDSAADQAALVAYANGNNPATCADPDNNVLFNLPHDSGSASGSAFEEHNGRGTSGAADGQPFSQFWFDDNWLARYMSAAYGAPQPDGLYSSPTRWQILGLDAGTWPQPGGSAPDQNALLGLYHIAIGDPAGALSEWNNVLNQAGTSYDSNNQRYTYSGLDQEYYLGLFKILTDILADTAGVSGGDQANLFQHSMSLRSNILSEQQYENGTPIGWCTDRFDTTSLINTETTSIQVLALGAGARYSYEAGMSPMANPAGYFLRPYGALSAVAGQSPTGYMVYGPYANLPTGSYTVDFYLRSGSPGSALTADLDVHDANSDTILGTNGVVASQFPGSNQWGRYSIGFTVSNGANQMEFRVNWGGQADMDVAAIRVR